MIPRSFDADDDPGMPMRFRVVALVGVLSLWHAMAWPADDVVPHRYSMKQATPDIGTNIKRDVVSGSLVPFDKRYAELTPEQQGDLKSQYEGMGPEDEPPFPVDGLRQIYKVLAAAQQELLVEGEMALLVEVDSEGQATSVSVLRTVDPKMIEFAASVLMLQSYKPALCEGRPCTMQFPFRLEFKKRTARPTSDRDFCAGSSGTIGERIEACTAAIASAGLSRASLAATYYNRGLEWRASGDGDSAIADYDQAILLDPRNFDYFYARGNVWRAKGDNDRAIADYDEAIRLNPGYANAFYNRGNAWSDKGDSDRAISSYSDAIGLDPQSANAFVNRGIEWSAKGDNDRAIADYDEAIRLDPRSRYAFSRRGAAWRAKGDLARAVLDYSEAIRLEPVRAATFFGRGFALYFLGQYDAATSDFTESGRLNPMHAYSPIWRGLAMFRSGRSDPALARSQLQQASQDLAQGEWPAPVMELLSGKIDPLALLAAAESSDEKKRAGRLCEAHFFLGQYLLIDGREKEAGPMLQTAADQCPKDFREYEGAIAELRRLAP